MYRRYAVFFTAPVGPLADAGAAWLGWDSAEGRRVAHPVVNGVDLPGLTAVPRRYGFHATLKAPFRLAGGVGELRTGVEKFARIAAVLQLDRLAVVHADGFIALRPVGNVSALTNFAANVVRHFDRFRAPVTEAEVARRRQSRLTARQDAQMLSWGYPYVFDDFQFHMTLSGPVDATRARQVLPLVQAHFAPLIGGPVMIDAITLMAEDAAGMFHQLHRARFSG